MNLRMFSRNHPQPLARQLTLLIVLKLVGLTAIWWFFIRDHKVPHDAGATAAQFLSTSTPEPNVK